MLLLLACLCNPASGPLDDSSPPHDSTETVEPRSSFVDISVGDTFACGVRTDGTLQCWGSSDAAPHGAKWRRVEQFNDMTCALDSAGEVCCWGTPAYVGDCSDQGMTYPSGPWVDLTANYSFACGLSADGQITCWGDAAGVGTTITENSSVPVVDITSRLGGVMALHADNTFSIWDVSPSNTNPIERVLSQVDLGLPLATLSLIEHGQGVFDHGSGSVVEVLQSEDYTGGFLSYEVWNAGEDVVKLVADNHAFCARYADGRVLCDAGDDDTGYWAGQYGSDPPADQRFTDFALWFQPGWGATGCGLLAGTGSIACWSAALPDMPMFTDLP